MDAWLWLVQIGTLLFLIHWYFKQKFSYWTKRNINGPLALPFFGNFWEVMWRGQIPTELDWQAKYGKVYGIYGFGLKPTLSISDNELIKQVLVKDFNLFVNRRQDPNGKGHPIWRHNLFNLENEAWKRVRTITSPTFTSGKLRGMNALMNQCIDKLANYFHKLSAKGSDGVFNTKEVISGFTIDVIASTSFATETSANDDRSSDNPFVYHGTRLLIFSKLRILMFIFIPTFVRNWIGITHGFTPEHFNFFCDLSQQVIKQRKESNLKRSDFVQLLMDARIDESDLKNSGYDKLTANADKEEEAHDTQENGKSAAGHQKLVKALDEDEIIAQCILFFIAGFETTASTITHALYELAMNQEIQDRLKDELAEKLDGVSVNSEQYYDTVMAKIPYLDAVIKETLRKYPPLPGVERRVSVENYKLGGITLEKEQVVKIAAYAVHHNAEYYPEPERYDPDRFMPENKHLLKPYTYLPFGQGPRNCIGMRFAYQEIKLFLAKIIPQFKFSPAPKTPAQLEFVKIGLLSVLPFDLKVSERV